MVKTTYSDAAMRGKQYQKIAQDILKIDFLELENSNKIKYNHGIFNLLRRMGE